MKKKVYKIACIVFLVIGVLLLIDGMTGRVDNNKLYEQKNITSEDLSRAPSTWVNTRETNENGITTRFIMLSGVECIGSMNLSEYECMDVSCSMGKAKILITDEEGKQLFYESVSELCYELGPAGEYNIWIVGKNFSGKVSVEY